MVSSEYATGQIRSTLAATPQRGRVLTAKVLAFVAAVLTAGLVTTFASFATGQAIFAGKDLDVSIGDPGVLRSVVGGALYLTMVGLLGVGRPVRPGRRATRRAVRGRCGTRPTGRASPG